MAEKPLFHSAPMGENIMQASGQLHGHQAETVGEILPFLGKNGRAGNEPEERKDQQEKIQAQEQRFPHGASSLSVGC